MTPPLECPVCAVWVSPDDWEALARHFVEQAEVSDAGHIMWLNRRVTKLRTGVAALAPMLHAVLERGEVPADTPRVTRDRRVRHRP